MSVSMNCPACQMGQHERHVEHWDKKPEGVLGGAHCHCSGDCEPPDLSRFGLNHHCCFAGCDICPSCGGCRNMSLGGCTCSTGGCSTSALGAIQ